VSACDTFIGSCMFSQRCANCGAWKNEHHERYLQEIGADRVTSSIAKAFFEKRLPAGWRVTDASKSGNGSLISICIVKRTGDVTFGHRTTFHNDPASLIRAFESCFRDIETIY